jgi:hypothetical protein
MDSVSRAERDNVRLHTPDQIVIKNEQRAEREAKDTVPSLRRLPLAHHHHAVTFLDGASDPEHGLPAEVRVLDFRVERRFPRLCPAWR